MSAYKFYRRSIAPDAETVNDDLFSVSRNQPPYLEIAHCTHTNFPMKLQNHRIPEEQAQDVLTRAAQLYAQHNQSYSVQELIDAGTEAQIPSEFMEEAIHQIELENIQAEAQLRKAKRGKPLVMGVAIALPVLIALGVAGWLLQRNSVTNAAVSQPAQTQEAISPPTTVSDATVAPSNFKCAGLSLNGADLSGKNLKGADCTNADLGNANLAGANLEGANLSHSNLENANLNGVNLNGADLARANLAGANLDSANLEGANLSNTDLRNANLNNATITRTDMAGANLDGTNLNNAQQ
ncbi:pentapeptide repeat-containing protein [Coleofasciculus sp. E2-BRE-01]|uniref:pentapeptide repeat-containing protein n=1 Tax=Coleofasciculus sp. E2-BRE-01 TaxID=3069524 RepID=UPI0032FE7FD4